ncbi:Uncharacterized protein Fot_13833 [Forsythia ovata]|uniref:Uncharacterized protein n=1 Tax=Forsythia ovata TaxID=205694 RepID=A0ABD1W543_9LAMI
MHSLYCSLRDRYMYMEVHELVHESNENMQPAVTVQHLVVAIQQDKFQVLLPEKAGVVVANMFINTHKNYTSSRTGEASNLFDPLILPSLRSLSFQYLSHLAKLELESGRRTRTKNSQQQSVAKTVPETICNTLNRDDHRKNQDNEQDAKAWDKFHARQSTDKFFKIKLVPSTDTIIGYSPWAITEIPL